MMYSYVKLADETQFSYSQVLEDSTVEVRVERPKDWGFDSARCLLPAYTWSSVEGFTDDEVKEFDTFVRNNAPLIWRFANEVTAERAYA